VGGYADIRGSGDYSFLLMKIDPDGNLIWNQTYEQQGSQEATAMTTASNGYVIVGNTQSTGGNMHAWVVKVDPNGNFMWAKTVGGEKADSPSCVTSSGDGGYLVGGFTFSFGAGNRDFWLFKITDSGNIVWSCTQGDKEYQEAYAVIPAVNNSYVMAGWTDPPNQPSLIGKARYMFYVVDISPKSGSGLPSLQLALYSAIALDILFASLILVSNLHKNHWPRNRPSSISKKKHVANRKCILNS